MIHPLFRLIASQPQMLADHVEAYTELVGQEVGGLATEWKRRAALGAVALCSGGVAVVLAGVAVMFWAVSPPENIQAPWALVLVPALPALLALWCYLSSRSSAGKQGFSALREQFAADTAMLREVSNP